MTSKVYKSAMGKSVDLGALLLQNEQVRAVGNMNVNARGDIIDGSSLIIDGKNSQVQRQYQKQSNVVKSPVYASAAAARKAQEQAEADQVKPDELDINTPVLAQPVVPNEDPLVNPTIPQGGLAAAIAKSKEIKQELEKTPRQKAQERPLRKL